MTDPTNGNGRLAQRVLKRITGEHLVPRPRWEFLFKNYSFWTLGVLSVALGAFAFSAALFEVANVDWRLSVATHANFFSFFLAAAPFLWMFILALFILVGYVNIRRTKHGYRYPLAVIALGAVLTSLTLGSGLYATGLGGELEEAVGDHPPFYRPILIEERSWWIAPEKGLLGGQIVSRASDAASFVLRDFNGRAWEVEGGDLHGSDLAAVAHGGVVRIVGVPTAATSSVFHACFVFPWKTYDSFLDEPLVPFPVIIASTSERNAAPARTDICKGIRPYEQLRTIDETGL